MRTKTLVLTVVLSAASVASSLAQVYSVNAVGYVNKTLVPGFHLIANQLDNKAANGNTISNLFLGLPEGTTIYPFSGTTFQTIGFEFGEWSNPNFQLNPGDGVFIFIPGTVNLTVTFVGEVKQGTGTSALANPIPKGLSIKASQVPQAGKLQADLKYVPEEGDTVYQFDTALKTYKTLGYEFGSWSAEPNLQIAESFFLSSPNAKTWTRDFTTSTP
jgi:hypothetical protein